MANHGFVVAIFGILACCVKADMCDPGHVLSRFGYCLPAQACRQKGYVIYENVCVLVCPNDVSYFYNETRTCYDECPPYTIQQGSHCINSSFCTQKYEVLYNRTCLASCPDEAPFLESGVCRTSCSSYMLSNGTDCIPDSRCLDEGWVKFNGTCRMDCPSEMPFNHSGACVTNCPNTFLIKDFTCKDSKTCLAASHFVYRGYCVKRCPGTSPYSGSGICNSSCPSTLFTHENRTECLTQNQCLKRGMMIWNGSCKFSCPKGTLFSPDGKCVTVCSKYDVSLERRCISSFDCNDFNKHNRVIFQRQCIESCPIAAPFIEAGYCKSKCSDGRVANGNICIFKYNCLRYDRVIHGGKCLSQCPIEALYLNPIKSVDISGFSCEKQCPSGKLKMDNTSYLNSLQCKRSTCKKNVKGVNCTSGDACPFIFQWDLCLENCPEQAPYPHFRRCLSSCPAGTVHNINETTCYPESQCAHPKNHHCPNASSCVKTRVIYNRTCLDACPPVTRFIIEGKCIADCSEGTLMCAKHRSWILISETVCLLPCLVLLNRLLKPRDRESHGRSTNIVWVKRNKQRGEEDQGRLSEEVEMDDTDMTVV